MIGKGRMFLAAAAAGLGLVSTAGVAPGALVDTFTRADASGTVVDSLGGTEAGGFDYTERGNTPGATIPTGTAEIVNNELRIYGRGGPLTSDTGGAYLSGYASAGLTLNVDVRFVHSIAAPSASEELANTFFVALRTRPTMNFGNIADDDGLLAIELGPNGDVLIRENRSGTLTNVFSANPITNSATTRRRLASGALPATINGGAFDTDQDGFIDDAESFDFGVELSGTLLKLFINGQQIGTDYTLQRTAGLNGSGVALHKNRVSSAFETASDVFVDNLELTPVPEPATAGLLLVAAGGALARRRRRA